MHPVRRDLPRLLRRTLDLCLVPLVQELGEGAQQLAEEGKRRVCMVVEAELADTKLNITRLVEQATVSVLTLPGLDEEAVKEGIRRLRSPAFRGLARVSPLPRLVRAVWAAVRERLLIPPLLGGRADSREPETDIACRFLLPPPEGGTARVSTVLIAVINDMVPYRDLRAVRGWWWSVAPTYLFWILLMLAITAVLIFISLQSHDQALVITTFCVSLALAVC